MKRGDFMLRLLILIGAIYLLYKMITGEKRHKTKEEVEEKAKVGEMVKDPVCGTYVSVESDIRVRDGEKVYYFCSYECRDKFLKQLEE